MIRPPGFAGVAFGTATEGDVRTDPAGRSAFIAAGAPQNWAYVSQVHGDRVLAATRPGLLGDADAIYTTNPDLAVTIATADCVPVAIEGGGFAAVIHAGWRGIVAGVVTEALRTFERKGLHPVRAAIGPGIGACCYEVGAEVGAQFPDHEATTTWGTASVDLGAAVAAQLGDLVKWRSDRCTMTDPGLYSYRRNRTAQRQVAVAWLASG